jgi:ribosome-associated translation inhibitor RaiA
MGKITLNGFDLTDYEKSRIEKIIQKHEKKLLNITEYEEIFLRLKKSAHGKTFLHEIECKIITKKGIFNSKKTDYNLFAVVSEVLEKTIKEITHKNEKSERKNEKEKSERKRQAKTQPDVPKI